MGEREEWDRERSMRRDTNSGHPSSTAHEAIGATKSHNSDFFFSQLQVYISQFLIANCEIKSCNYLFLLPFTQMAETLFQSVLLKNTTMN